MCNKNDNGEHYGDVNCAVCRKDFEWIEGKNADAVVDKILLDGPDTFIDLNVTAKCPECNYKCTYLFTSKGNHYR